MDREKVMKAIEICIKTGCKNGIPNQLCPYSSEVGCDLNQILADALALLKEDCHNCKLECLLQKYDELKEKYDKLLKEQEPVKPVLDEQTGRIWLCGKCGSYVGFEDNDPHDPNEYDKYCRECGRPVLWEGR